MCSGRRWRTSSRPHGLTLRHFPQSFEFSTLGGWLATRSGGHYATRVHAHRRPRRVDAGRHAGRDQRVAPAAGLRRRPVAGPAVPRLGGHARHHHRGVDAAAGPPALAGAGVRPLRATTTTAVAATRAIAQSRAVPDQLPAARRRPRRCSRGRQRRRRRCSCSASSRPTTRSTRGSTGRVELCRDHGGERVRRRQRRGPAASHGGGRRRDMARRRSCACPYQRDALARHSVIAETFETACTWDRFHAAARRGHRRRRREAIERGLRRRRGDAAGSPTSTPTARRRTSASRARAAGQHRLAQWDEIKAAASEAHRGAAAARSPTTTPSAATTAPGTTGSGPSRSRPRSPRPSARSTPRACSTPACSSVPDINSTDQQSAPAEVEELLGVTITPLRHRNRCRAPTCC